jgi:hypothetical protein
MPTSSSASSLSMSWRTDSPGSSSTTTTRSVDLTRKSSSAHKPSRVSMLYSYLKKKFEDTKVGKQKPLIEG